MWRCKQDLCLQRLTWYRMPHPGWWQPEHTAIPPTGFIMGSPIASPVTLNDTAATNSTSFSATWQWAGTSYNATTVHSFPNINLNSDVLPIQLSNLSSLKLDLSWSMTPGEVANATSTTTASSLAAIDVRADVALDLWLDDSPTSAQSATYAGTEVMVWQAAYGGVSPIGYTSSVSATAPTLKVGGTTYTLYHGTNTNNQSVYSWYPSKNMTSFNADVSPLLSYLWQKEYIEESLYLGLVQWGSEAIHSAAGENVTFWARSVSLDVVRGTPTTASAAPKVSGSAALGWLSFMSAVLAFALA
ncbi:hypothetical protein BP6252_03851 [Coleophoma cylindrospora]|uniref:Glycoside hydrolase family 12 protein n=1 Tax=Coleophoma cylindrospora TaxID=1849047 RepID=A0A3D8S8R3_9HELO|nr:hypothetical protein BP6252_03851 [Coleophoma cylindrospora]